MKNPVLILCLMTLFFGVALAQDQQPGSDTNGWPCGKKIDPAYIEVAEGTGGQVLMLDPSEASKSMVLMEAQLKGIDETIFRAGGKMSGLREYVIPIDSSVESMTVSAFAQCMDSIVIQLPGGGEFKPGQGGPQDNVFHSGRVFTLDRPVAGDWKVRVSGNGYHSLIVLAKSDIALVDFEFVQSGGRPGHEGYFPTHEVPKAGIEQMISLELSGVKEASVKLVNSNQKEIQQARITESYPSDDGVHLYGTIKVPPEPFRVIVEGTDAKGQRWQRLHAALWAPQKQ